jgi:hypothetical protein
MNAFRDPAVLVTGTSGRIGESISLALPVMDLHIPPMRK